MRFPLAGLTLVLIVILPWTASAGATSALNQLFGTEPTIRVGLAFGSGAPDAITLAAPSPTDTLTLSQGGVAVMTLPPVSYVRLMGYGYTVAQGLTASAAEATVTSLRQAGDLAYLVRMGASDQVVEGMYRTEAQAAAAPAPAGGTPFGPAGQLMGSYATLSAAQAAAAAMVAQGTWAAPMFAGGSFHVFADPGWSTPAILGGTTTSPSGSSGLSSSFPSVGTSSPSAGTTSPGVGTTSSGAGTTPPVVGSTPYTPTGSEVEVVGPNGGILCIVAAGDPGLTVTGSQDQVAFRGVSYRGTLTVLRLPGAGLTVINAVPLEQYVEGVVPREMPADWAPQALMAQAVAARTYVLAHLGEHADEGFDVTATTADQVYGGLSAETPQTDADVQATRGQILTYDGAPIDAFFEADSGGHTASSQNVFDQALPYIKGVPELPGCPIPRWTIRATPGQLAQDAARAGVNLGSVTGLMVRGRGASGRALHLFVQGTAGAYEVSKDAIRGFLGLPSTLFRIHSNATVTVVSALSTPVTYNGGGGLVAVGAQGVPTPLPSTYTVEGASGETTYPLVPTRYTFHGKGDGHGLGMTQDGAQFMATKGYTYTQILHYYYTGVTLTTLPYAQTAATPGGQLP